MSVAAKPSPSRQDDGNFDPGERSDGKFGPGERSDGKFGPGERSDGNFVRPDDRPVEFWPTSAIRAALDNDDLDVWQRIVAAIKRDPFGRTARQVEEVLETEQPYGVSAALAEVLEKAREHLETNERAEVSRHVHQLLERSGLGAPEFASRIGVPIDEFTGWLEAVGTPSASMMIRMRRLSDRFARIRAQRAANSG